MSGVSNFCGLISLLRGLSLDCFLNGGDLGRDTGQLSIQRLDVDGICGCVDLSGDLFVFELEFSELFLFGCDCLFDFLDDLL